jgi:hypothetical protein
MIRIMGGSRGGPSARARPLTSRISNKIVSARPFIGNLLVALANKPTRVTIGKKAKRLDPFCGEEADPVVQEGRVIVFVSSSPR